MFTQLVMGLLFVLTTSEAQAHSPSSGQTTRFEFSETHMGTAFHLVLYTESEPIARSASRDAFKRVAELDAILSDYRPDSELMKLCARAGGPPVPVSEPLFRVLERAKQVHDLSSGAFDVTVAPVVRLWRRARRERKMPEPDRLTDALGLVGSEHLILDARQRSVQLQKKGMKLDLGGLAKGFAADEALKVLRSKGISQALVAAAGDIVVGDPPPGKEGWTIGIAALNPARDAPKRLVSLSRSAVSTAGDAEQFIEIDGKRYAHIVDPRTGLGVVDRCSVTVFAPDGLTADSLDTAIYILGPDKGLPLVENTPDAAAFIIRLDSNQERTYESSRMRQIPAASSASKEKPRIPIP